MVLNVGLLVEDPEIIVTLAEWVVHRRYIHSLEGSCMQATRCSA